MAVNSFNDVTKQIQNTINTITQPLKKGSDLSDQIGSLGSKTSLAAEHTNGPEGSKPPAIPATPPASTPAKAAG